MFTGIIEAVGRIERLAKLEGGRRLAISCPFADALQVGESAALNGICLTVVNHDDSGFDVVAVEETLGKTSLGDLVEGDPVNLERAMRADGRFDGHIVQGHVDGTGTVESIEQLADSWLVSVRYPADFASSVIPAGSITVDGISLTVARLNDESFTVAIIPHTFANTTASSWQVGRRVNLEFDVLGKYVARILAMRS